MKNICITKSNNKFNKNIIYYQNSNTTILEIEPFIESIYKHHYRYNQIIDTYIINTSLLSDEIVAFISDFNLSINFILYHDIFSEKLAEKLHPVIKKHIVNEGTDYTPAITIPRYIVNELLYQNVTSQHRSNQMVYFLDNDTSIPIMLQNVLYPNSDLPIKMFNSNALQHYQNLGLINELERRDILSESSVYLYSNDEYLPEAMLCGCRALDINDSFDLDKSYMPEISYSTYGQFLKDNIL